MIAVVLAAGKATRFGSCKQVAEIGGKPMIGRVLEALPGSLSKYVVTGAHAEKVEAACVQFQCELVENPQFESGMGSSVRVAASLAKELDEDLLITLCDLPFVTRRDYLRLIKAYGGKVLFSAFNQNFGPPAIFPKSTLEQLALLGDSESPKMMFPYAEKLRIQNAAMDIDYPISTEGQTQAFVDNQ